MFGQFSKNWHLLAVNGIIALLIGILALFVPETTIIVVAKYFGIVLLLGGAVLLYLAINNMRKDKPFGLVLIESIISLILGLIILVYTKETLSVFVILIGLWAIIMGITQLVLYSSIKDQLSNKTLVIANALLTLVFGVVVFFNPFTAAVAFTAIFGIIAIVAGIVMIVIAFKVKNADKG